MICLQRRQGVRLLGSCLKKQIGNAKETLPNFKPCHNHFQELLTLTLTASQSQQTNTAPGSEQDPSGSCSTPKPGLPLRSTDQTHLRNICCGMVRHRDPAGTVGTSTVSLTSGCSFFVLPLLQFHLQFHTRPFQYFQLHF